MVPFRILDLPRQGVQTVEERLVRYLEKEYSTENSFWYVHHQDTIQIRFRIKLTIKVDLRN